MFFVVSAFPVFCIQASGKVRLATGHWPPYFDESANNGGMLAELITKAYATQGLSTHFTFLPWSRALMLAKSDQFDGTAAWSCVEERSDDFLYSFGVLPYHYVFFHRRSLEFDWVSYEGLKEMSVGVTQDYSYNQMFENLADQGIVSTEMTASDETNFRKLLAGRIDLFPMDPLVGMSMIKQWIAPEEAEELTFYPKPFSRSYYHVLFSHTNPRGELLRQRLDKGLRILWSSGEFDAIVEKWLAFEDSADEGMSRELFRPLFAECDGE